MLYILIVTITDLMFSTAQHDDDVVITFAGRSALCKGGKGSFKDTTLDALLYKFLVEVRPKLGIDPALIEDITLGNVREPNGMYYRQIFAICV